MLEKLTTNFSLEELSVTNRDDYQTQNLREARGRIGPLLELARLLERIRLFTGPLEIHSGFRCKALNDAVGSSDRSQHIKGEAADFSSPGVDTEESWDRLFQHVLYSLIANQIPFGQLIREMGQSRDYKKSLWIHISLGSPFRLKEKCGQILEMKQMPGKPPKYTLLKRVDFHA